MRQKQNILFFSIFLLFFITVVNKAILPRVCYYDGYVDPITKEYYMAKLSDPYEIIQTNGQNYQVTFSATNITPDVVGMLIRLSRLKNSEGDHPSDQGDDHGNPRSDEDKVQYSFYVLPGLSPQTVFKGEYSKDGTYQLSGYINLGEDICPSFGDLQTEKEYRVQFIVWSTFMASEDEGFSEMPLQEIRFKANKFESDSQQFLSVKRNQIKNNDTSSTGIGANWKLSNVDDTEDLVVFWQDKIGNITSFTEKPIKGKNFNIDYIEASKMGVEDGSKIGIQSTTNLIIIPPIGGGGIIGDLCEPILPPCPPLSAPNLISVSESSNPQGLEIVWSSVTGASFYNIYRGTSCTSTFYPIANLVTGTSYIDTSVQQGQTYAYKVKALSSTDFGRFCSSGFSNCISATYTCQSCSVLASPTLISPANGTVDLCPKPSFQWSNVSNNKGYNLEIYTTPECTGSPFFSVSLPQNTTTYSLSSVSLPASTTCSWRVKTLGDAQCYCDSYFSTPYIFTTKGPCTVLSPPAIIRPCLGSQTCPNPLFEWTYDSNATGGYKLEIFDSSGTSLILSITLPQSQTNWQNSGLSQGSYTWHIQALGDNYCYYCNSPFSGLCSFTIQNISVGTVYLVEPENGVINEYTSPSFVWTPINDPALSYYRVKVFTGGCDTNLVATSPNLTSTQWCGSLQPGNTYYWKVEAINSDGCVFAVSECRHFQTGSICY